jgi:hypothetical protein
MREREQFPTLSADDLTRVAPGVRPIARFLKPEVREEVTEAFQAEEEVLKIFPGVAECQRGGLFTFEDLRLRQRFLEILSKTRVKSVEEISEERVQLEIAEMETRRGEELFRRVMSREEGEFCRDNLIPLKDFVEIRDRLVVQSLTPDEEVPDGGHLEQLIREFLHRSLPN